MKTNLSSKISSTRTWFGMLARRLALWLLALTVLLLATTSAQAAVRYVDASNASPAPPYTSWASAAATIQQAVDAAQAGDEIVVTNGTYATGGRAVFGTMTNRVAVDKPLMLRSVNGPQVTIIQGAKAPGGGNGNGAIRCVYLANGASLFGFTLTDGGGGVWCESASAVVSNCVLTGNSASEGGGAYGGTLNNCTLTGNSASEGGGGAAGSTLNNCTLTGNWADSGGGGAAGSTLNNCTITGNWADSGGGGAVRSTLNNCTLTGNSAGYDGGGAYGSTLHNCTLTGNSARNGGGGGASDSTLNNCTLKGNSATRFGGGAFGGTLNNCTLTGNSAGYDGGGAYGGTLNNCIVYFNWSTFGTNWANYGSDTVLNYCCTTPLPPGGVGNLSLDPQLASATHLSATSPCRGAGSAAYATGTDIDGEPWATPPSIGCDEYHAGALTGPLSVNIASAFTNVAVGFQVELTALIDGRTSASGWDFGDGVVVSNRPYATHAWTTAGDYTVQFRAYNESHADGVSATVVVHVTAQPVHYVAADSAQPVPPYTSWATAAKTIQDAVDVATMPGTLVLVTNGIYATGGRAVGTDILENRVAVDKPLTLRSVNGPQFTRIQGAHAPGGDNGYGAIRCVYLANGAIVSGFTLTNGAAESGGGVWCESVSAVVSNCVLTGNSASEGGGAYGGTLNNCTITGNSAPGYGGGVFEGTLNNCTITGNSATRFGGGAYGGTLNNCTLTGNSAGRGGGGGASGGTLNNCTLTGNSATWGGGAAYGTLNNCTLTGNSATMFGGGASAGTLNNCIVYFNTAPTGANYYYAVLNYSCTMPLPTNGFSNIANVPLFVDYTKGNLRLQANSPCINAGLNASAPSGMDLDGNPRIVSGTVDIGAYEFQGAGSVISYAWLQQYGLPIDGSADYADPDHDGLNNWQEWHCWTSPIDALSALRLLSASSNGTNMTVSWQSVAGVNYFLERSTNLSATLPFMPLANGITGQPGTTTFTDSKAMPPALRFYRVGVEQYEPGREN